MGSRFFSKRVPQRTKVRRPRARPKTFKTEDAANAYAKENKISKFTITKLSEAKFRIDTE